MRFLSGKHGFELSSVFKKALKMVKKVRLEKVKDLGKHLLM